jgi:actin-related protein 9
VAAFGILERPMAQMYASNSLSGVVVDIGDEKTDITPIYDGFVIQQARTTTSLGIHDCETYLAHLLRSNQSVVSALSPPSTPLTPEALLSTLLELVKHIWREGYIKIPSDGETAAPEDEGVTDIAAVLVAGREKAVIESGMKKKATAKASAAEQARAREIEALDLVTIQFREHSLTLGKERHRFCEPLFDPTLLKGIAGLSGSANSLPLQDAVGLAVGHAEVDQRQYVWSGLFVTGDLTRHVRGVLLSQFAFFQRYETEGYVHQASMSLFSRVWHPSLRTPISRQMFKREVFVFYRCRNTTTNTGILAMPSLDFWVQA